MKRILFFLTPFILLGAGCASSSTVSSSLDTQANETSLATTRYVMSNNLLVFSAPSDWSVVQKDGGSASVIEIGSSTDVSMTISVEIAETFEGEPIAYQDWLAKDARFSKATSTTDVGGYTFDVHDVVTQEQGSRQVLTSEIQGEDSLYIVSIWLPVSVQTQQEAILKSLVFNPSVEDRSTAEVLR